MRTLEECTLEGTTVAPVGQVWVCLACGKRSRTKYGFDTNNVAQTIDPLWDSSCMLHAVLCHDPPNMVDGKPHWKAVA